MKAFVNARAVEGPEAVSRPSTITIIVDDNGRIESVGGDELAVFDAWDVIDCGNQVVYPGLIDM